MWLAKFLATCGFGSRRACIELIKAGQVTINNQIITNPAIQINNEDIFVNKQKAIPLSPKLFLYYKKPGYIVSHSDSRPTIFDDTSYDLISVGRLDYYTEGLMLLTNNSTIAHFWETSKCTREYCVTYIGNKPIPWSEYYLINNIKYGPVRLTSYNRSGIFYNVYLSINEGKNREIRNICKYLEWKVKCLVRIKFGPFSIDQITQKLTIVEHQKAANKIF